jgi:protein PsiE
MDAEVLTRLGAFNSNNYSSISKAIVSTWFGIWLLRNLDGKYNSLLRKMIRVGGNIKNSKFDELVSLGIINLERLLLLFIVGGTVWAAGIDILGWFDNQNKMALSDLFLLFIYAEILGMVGAFYRDNRIPVTLPLIIAITALTRMIVLTTKGSDPIYIVYESLGILFLALSAIVLSFKDKMSLNKLKESKRNNLDNNE